MALDNPGLVVGLLESLVHRGEPVEGRISEEAAAVVDSTLMPSARTHFSVGAHRISPDTAATFEDSVQRGLDGRPGGRVVIGLSLEDLRLVVALIARLIVGTRLPIFGDRLLDSLPLHLVDLLHPREFCVDLSLEIMVGESVQVLLLPELLEHVSVFLASVRSWLERAELVQDTLLLSQQSDVEVFELLSLGLVPFSLDKDLPDNGVYAGDVLEETLLKLAELVVELVLGLIGRGRAEDRRVPLLLEALT